MRGRRGFTLIELLVVIAIIGILAAMLFPVFARARESARKIQCLSNMKNLALAWQMYLTDYDRFPPNEHRAEVVDFFQEYGAGGCVMVGAKTEGTFNPFLRVPVILDEYIKNRDIWRCPSGRIQHYFPIVSTVPDWWTEYRRDSSMSIGCSRFTCTGSYPPGWGGDITDSRVQGMCAGGEEVPLVGMGGSTGAFRLNYVIPMTCRETGLAAVSDPAAWVVTYEHSQPYYAGWQDETSTHAAYELCGVEYAACRGCTTCCWEESCDQRGRACVAGDPRLQTDPEFRKNYEYSKPRHLGGHNIAFADGHAKWFNSEAIITGGTAGPYMAAGTLFENLRNCGYGPAQ